MPDYRVMFDSQHLKSWHLDGQPRTLTIGKVSAGVIENHKAKKRDKMPFIYFVGRDGKLMDRPLGLNKTNAKTIAGMYGPKTEEWVGKRITLYPTTTSFGNDTVDCIRIKPQVPTGKKDDEMPANPTPPAGETAQDGEGAIAGEAA